MNKTIKRVIGATLAISAFSVIEPAKHLGLNVEAKADSQYGIKDMQINEGTSSDSLQLYSDSKFKNKVEFDENTKTYFTKVSSNFINLNLSAEKGYEVKAFKNSRDTAAAYDSGDKIFIGSGTTIIYVRTYEKGDFDADDVKYGAEKEYQIYVTRTDTQVKDDDQDSIYLKDITLDAGKIDFDKEVTFYDVAVEVADNTITIEAEPENDGDKITVNGSTLDYDDKDEDEEEVKLKLGSNIIEIVVRDKKDKRRTYTLNVVRGDANVAVSDGNKGETEDNSKSENNSTTNGNTANSQNNTTSENVQQSQQASNTSSYKNQWVMENGVWKYHDSTGESMKNMWFNDRNTGKEYYFYGDGSMATGWIAYNGQWYYMGQDGAKRTGWTQVGGNWYYLDSLGAMKTGWFKDYDGKWYYLYNTGIMAQNTVIDGYSLGADGSMI